MQPTIINGVPELTPEQVLESASQLKLIDVRTPAEFVGELAHVKGAQLITLGPDLLDFLENGDRQDKIVFICRSGGRSAQATMVSVQMGYVSVYNMTGGMLAWNARGLSVEK